MNFIDIIESYIPKDKKEEKDLELMKQFANNHENIYSRNNLIGHVTSSVIILDLEKKHILLGYHNIYKSWGWFGGHNDGNKDCLKVALKEATEETGLNEFKLINEYPLAIDVVYVQNHIKHGSYVPDHLHLNVTYGLLTDLKNSIQFNKNEHSGIKWFKISQYLHSVEEPRMIPIYKKLIKRMLK
jgi:8-oxo-dGTP pyrophosphatase MutT (NUDIX family)